MHTTRWIVGIDLSELSEQALARALADAHHNDRTELHAVLVLDDDQHAGPPTEPNGWDDVLRRGNLELAQFVRRVRLAARTEACVSFVLHVAIGLPQDAIVSVAEEVGATQIFVGTHGRKGLRRALLGSVAESVVRRAPCPVLVVRPCAPRDQALRAEPAVAGDGGGEPAGEDAPHVYRYTSVLDPLSPPGHLL